MAALPVRCLYKQTQHWSTRLTVIKVRLKDGHITCSWSCRKCGFLYASFFSNLILVKNNCSDGTSTLKVSLCCCILNIIALASVKTPSWEIPLMCFFRETTGLCANICWQGYLTGVFTFWNVIDLFPWISGPNLKTIQCISTCLTDWKGQLMKFVPQVTLCCSRAFLGKSSYGPYRYLFYSLRFFKMCHLLYRLTTSLTTIIHNILICINESCITIMHYYIVWYVTIVLYIPVNAKMHSCKWNVQKRSTDSSPVRIWMATTEFFKKYN